MKAIVMAGGEGTRLRPISANMPKPMVELLEKPVLDHNIALLRKNGIDDICITLRYMPHIIMEHVGMTKAEMRIENEPLGTAGSVRACADFIGGEDFLVISGDCVCDFDLKSLISFHKRKGSDATLALYAQPDPLEYGLVVTDSGGKIERFIEKPSWDKVLTNHINTGIYVLSAKVLGDIPAGQNYDFGKDLFPDMLRGNKNLYGLVMDGYWCDIGSPEAYLRCTMDVLEGRLDIDIDAPEIKSGIWSASALPADAVIVPPVYIGKDVKIAKGAAIGPCALIGSGVSVGSGAEIKNSIVSGGAVHKNANINGAVICKKVSVGAGSSICEGAVIGDGCIIGEDCVISSRAKLWPDRNIPGRKRIDRNIAVGMLKGDLTFGGHGAVSGEMGITITPEACISLGAAAAQFGKAGVSWVGGSAARVAAQALCCGICAAGGSVVEFDGYFEAAASFFGYNMGLPLTAFASQNNGQITITFFGPDGVRLSRDMQRKLENGGAERIVAHSVGTASHVTGTQEMYASACSRAFVQKMNGSRGFDVAVSGNGYENRVLRSVLADMGFCVVSPRSGIPVFEAVRRGMALRATDDTGQIIDTDHLMAIAVLFEFESGSEAVAVPYNAPSALDAIAKVPGRTLLRTDRDGKAADEIYIRQMFLRDGIFAAAHICAHLAVREETLGGALTRVPRFTAVSREIPISGECAETMRQLAKSCETASEMVSGLKIDTGRGWVRIYPRSKGAAIRIRSEGATEEIAEELCFEFEELARKIDAKQIK